MKDLDNGIKRIKLNVDDFAKECELNIEYSADNEAMTLVTEDTNRPGLLLAGYNDYFEHTRVQVMGNAEMNYLLQLDSHARETCLRELMKKNIPCVVICRSHKIPAELMSTAKEYGVPIFTSSKSTSDVLSQIGHYLKRILADTSRIHGVLIDIDGLGVLITGKSGIGKSETALELVHRGHRLVADDSVEIRKVDNKLYGSSPESIRYFMEIRGVGIIDVKSMFGIAGVIPEKKIKLVVELEERDLAKEYERLGLEDKFTYIMGVKIPKLTIPVMPGRNLAIVMEVAAKNNRLRHFGYSAAEELQERLMRRISDISQ